MDVVAKTTLFHIEQLANATKRPKRGEDEKMFSRFFYNFVEKSGEMWGILYNFGM